MQLRQFCDEDDEEGNDIYTEEGDIVMRVMSAQEETIAEGQKNNNIQIHRYKDIKINRYTDIQINRYTDIKINRYAKSSI